MVERYPDDLALVTSADGLDAALADGGRIGSLLGAEGGHCIDNSLGTLRDLYRLGVRYLTLTHNENTDWADSATDEPGARRADRVRPRGGRRDEPAGHAGRPLPRRRHHHARRARRQRPAPVIFSHSSAPGRLRPPAQRARRRAGPAAGNGGICMVTFVPYFVSPAAGAWALEVKAAATRPGWTPGTWTRWTPSTTRGPTAAPRATLDDVVAHLEHAREVAGIDHLGLGGDYDGVAGAPVGLEDVSRYPVLLAALRERGAGPTDDLARLAHGNITPGAARRRGGRRDRAVAASSPLGAGR